MSFFTETSKDPSSKVKMKNTNEGFRSIDSDARIIGLDLFFKLKEISFECSSEAVIDLNGLTEEAEVSLQNLCDHVRNN